MSLENKYNVHTHNHSNDFSFQTTSPQGKLSVHSLVPGQNSKVSRELCLMPMWRSLMLGTSLSVVFV